jgi:sugar lactone lactonase YvrE
VRRGPDGALYVSELTGAPFAPGAAGIYRVVPGQAPTLYRGGFTQITDFAWAPDGTLYVLQYGSAPFLGGPGALIRVSPNGTRTTVTTALEGPTGLAIAPDGTLYVAHKHFVPGGGEVLAIVP